MRPNKLKIALTCVALAAAAGIVGAQSLTDLGTTTPTPGPLDISQLSTTVNASFSPGGLNYFTDNGANNGAAAGQIFTTGANSGGYVVTNLIIKSGAGNTGGGGTGLQTGGYIFRMFSVSTTNATLLATYTAGQNTFTYTPGDWVQMSGIALLLNPSSTYAYSFQRTSAGWDNLDVSSNNPYAGGQIALIRNTAGTNAVNYGTANNFDAGFDIGLALPAAPIVGIPTATPNPVYALSPVTISDSAVGGITYQWQTNSDTSGGLAGTWGNVAGATALTITNTPPDLLPNGSDYTLDYQLVAVNASGSATSSPVALTVHAATAPLLVTDTTPASVTTFAGATLTLNATFVGTTPITFQWQTDAGQTGTFTNIPVGTVPSAGTQTLTITNIQGFNSGNYRLSATNLKGNSLSDSALVTIFPVLYQEGFNLATPGDQSVTNAGWRNDIFGADNRVFSNNGGVTFPNNAVYSYDGNAATEAFYTTTATANGSISNHEAFPIINLATAQNLVLGVDMNVNGGGTWNAFFAVQMNFNQWYASTTALSPEPTSQTFITETLPFSPTASGWDLLSLSGTGSLNNNNFPIIGAAAASDLNGYITGSGIVIVHTTGGDVQFDNFVVGGSIPATALPVISSPPFSVTNYTGTTATLSVTASTNGTTAGLTYQWKSGTVGSGVYANLSNGGQFSGVNTSTLTISNVTSAANHKDYIVVVTDGAGSATSAPAATLTVIDSAPILTSDTVIFPDAAPLFGNTNTTIHAGNNNVENITASFKGNQPFSYQWQVSPNPDGSGAVNVSGATSSVLTLSNPQPSNSGYYSLRVSNSQSITPTNSGWAQLTVSNAASSTIQWSAPVIVNGLTSTQVLGSVPGTFLGAESFGATATQTVNVGATSYVFDTTGVAAALTTGATSARTPAYSGPSSGDANLDAVFNVDEEDSGTPTITLNNLVTGNLYSAQLFAINDIAGGLREINFSDSVDFTDVSGSFLMGDNKYVVGTFIATGATQVIAQHLADSHGYISAVVVRNALPTVTALNLGSSIQLSWNFGTLLQSTSVTGPYTAVPSATSPTTVSTTGPSKFFRVSFP